MGDCDEAVEECLACLEYRAVMCADSSDGW